MRRFVESLDICTKEKKHSKGALNKLVNIFLFVALLNRLCHSLRAKMATRGLARGIPDKFMLEKTGHSDVRSLQLYQRPSIEYKVEMSKEFDQVGMMPKPLATTSSAKSEGQEVSEKPKEDLGSEDKISEGDSVVKSDRVEKCVSFNNCTYPGSILIQPVY